MKLIPLSFFSDGDLVRRALKENPHAGEELVFRNQRKACAIVHASGIRSDKLDDIIQESFLRPRPLERRRQRMGPASHVRPHEARRPAEGARGRLPQRGQRHAREGV